MVGFGTELPQTPVSAVGSVESEGGGPLPTQGGGTRARLARKASA